MNYYNNDDEYLNSVPDGWAKPTTWEDMSDEERLGWSAEQLAKVQLETQSRTRKLAMKYAAPTAEELQSLALQLENFNKTNALQEQELARASKIVETIDPNIMESAKQVYSILKGGSSEFLNPLQSQRIDQRKQLESQLAEQLGPGWQTSTAGQQALANFDKQTGEVLTNARFSALGQLTGISQAYSGMRPDLGARVNQNSALTGQMLSDMNVQRGRFQERQIGAINATPLTPYAGANYVGAYTQAQADIASSAQTKQIWGQIGGAVLGAAAGVGMKAATGGAG